MSTEHHPNHTDDPRHDDVAFEGRDFQAGTIYMYLAALAVAVVISLAATVYILRFTTKVAEQADAPPPPIKAELSVKDREERGYPPEPRLQGVPGHVNDPQEDLRQKLKADNEANSKLEWVDKNAGIVQIPVKDAMKIIAEKGLPSIPAAAKK